MTDETQPSLAAERYKIEDLLRLVQDGRIRLPRFQRPLRWTGTDVERLFDSIYQGYPIGTLLFWLRPAKAETVSLGPVEIEAPQQTEAHWVVDGQQRLTSLAASLLPRGAHPPDARFEIVFDLATEQFSQASQGDSGRKIPVREAYDLQRVLPWLRDRPVSEEEQSRAFKLADRLRNYDVPAYKLRAADQETLQDIFDRTNTFGKSMTKAEVFQALNTSATEPRADIGTLRTEIETQRFGSLGGNTLLYSVLGARGPDVLREFRSEFKSEADRIDALRLTRLAVERSIDFLRNYADVPHFELVPYQHQQYRSPCEPEEQTLTSLRRWFWVSSARTYWETREHRHAPCYNGN